MANKSRGISLKPVSLNLPTQTFDDIAMEYGTIGHGVRHIVEFFQRLRLRTGLSLDDIQELAIIEMVRRRE